MSELNRRNFLQRAMVLGAATAVGGVFAAGCNKDGGAEDGEPSEGGEGLDCTDVSDLEAAQVTMRNSMAYIEVSTTDGQTCENCALYVAGGGCGTCTLIAGPINPAGWCSVWAAAA